MRIFNIPPDVGFLPALVEAILGGGFPTPEVPPPGPAELSLWTILVPTRRAARALQQAFLDAGDGAARLFPQIRPIGDVDEDLIDTEEGLSANGDAALPPAVSRIGRDFILVDLIDRWADDNPQERLAAEIQQSPAHSLALARGLGDLIDSFETEEANLAALSGLFQGDFAEHRLAILGFLAIVRQHLPARLAELNRMGPTERRSRLIRLEAERLARSPLKGPVIAAGSTGSIPATAELLRVIAGLELGAVILPGLDPEMDDASWDALTPQHPQFGLKSLLDRLRVKRADVETLAGCRRRASGSARAWLGSELMRPSDTAHAWQAAVNKNRDRIAAAVSDIHLIEARHRQEEALTIALILRRTLDEPTRTAALVTPDRELARRVKSELKRWNIEIDDSAGEPLSRTTQGSLLALLTEAVTSGLSAAGVAVLIHHPLLRMGFGEMVALKLANIFDIAVLRYGRRSPRIGEFHKTVEEIRGLAEADRHRPETLRRLTSADWNETSIFARRLDGALAPLAEMAGGKLDTIANHLQVLLACAETLSASPAPEDEFWIGEGAETLAALIEAIGESSGLLPEITFSRAAPLLLGYLNQVPVRSRASRHARLSILGLLEARLVRADVVVMGGLNEGRWPSQPDSGPWLNRPMRSSLGLAMPERHIGLTAHDFVQAFGAETVYLTWSKRVGDAPAVPSRWILRLQTLITAAGVGASQDSAQWLGWARGIDAVPPFRPVEMPRPAPPRSARPKSLSFTDIETLIRDPYAIYASKVLRLEPMSGIAEPGDAALRGQLIHEALNRFVSAYPDRLPGNASEELIRFGTDVFAPHMDEADIAGFWWPRFLRIAPWFVEQDAKLREAMRDAKGEVSATHKFDIAGEEFKLSGRADRIDTLEDGTARIIDFKTGDLPSKKQVEAGLSPQLTLEAAVLEQGGFVDIPPKEVSQLLYVKLSGGEPAGDLVPLEKMNVMKVARAHLAGLKRLLVEYAEETNAYIPRRIPKTETEVSPYDHLSRRGEWERKEAAE